MLCIPRVGRGTLRDLTPISGLLFWLGQASVLITLGVLVVLGIQGFYESATQAILVAAEGAKNVPVIELSYVNSCWRSTVVTDSSGNSQLALAAFHTAPVVISQDDYRPDRFGSCFGTNNWTDHKAALVGSDPHTRFSDRIIYHWSPVKQFGLRNIILDVRGS